MLARPIASIRLFVVSSRIFAWPVMANVMSGGRFSPAMRRRTSAAASSSAWPGATSEYNPTENCRWKRCTEVAALALEHANLDWVLLRTLPIRRDLVVAGDRQAERVADRRHAHAKIGRAPAVDRHAHFGVGDVERDLRVREARRLLRLRDRLQGVVAKAIEVGSQKTRRDGEANASARLAAAERAADADAGPHGGPQLQPVAHLSDHLVLRALALIERHRLHEHVNVRRPFGDGGLDLCDAVDAAQLLHDLLRVLRGPFERCPLRRVEMNRPLPHVLVRNERT